MPRAKSGVTRQKILDTAEEMLHRQGYAATSIDQIIEQVGITKGSFFYHFKTKGELAKALIDRFAAGDGEILRSCMERAERLSADPLQQLLIFVGLLLEVAEGLDDNPQPGCLFATYCFEQGLFEEETYAVISRAILNWRRALGEKLRLAAKAHPTVMEVDPDSVADMLTVLFEGAFVLSRSLQGRGVFAAQIRHYRSYLQLLFGVPV